MQYILIKTGKNQKNYAPIVDIFWTYKIVNQVKS